jgi:multiple antibiotic resistance protein
LTLFAARPYDGGSGPFRVQFKSGSSFFMNPAHAFARLLHTLPNAATATFLALFPIVNPFGGIPMFFALTENFSRTERNRTALKVAGWVFVILVTFMFFGRFVLSLFGISLPVLKIAGGLIVANTAWGMVTASSRLTVAESADANTKEDISLTPMAMPLLSGPGSIGVVMGLAANVESVASYAGIVIGIIALSLSVYLFLRMGGPFVGRLGPNAVGAITRIFGFLILAIAVQLVADGIFDLERPEAPSTQSLAAPTPALLTASRANNRYLSVTSFSTNSE